MKLIFTVLLLSTLFHTITAPSVEIERYVSASEEESYFRDHLDLHEVMKVIVEDWMDDSYLYVH